MATLADALVEGLGPDARRASVSRASRVEMALPAGWVEVAPGEPVDAVIASVDAAGLAEASAGLASAAVGSVAGTRVAWVMPDARPGVWGWVVTRARRLAPVAIEDACDAFRRAGIVDVRVTHVDASVPLVVLSGVSTGP